VSVRLPDDLLARVDAESARLHESRAATIRRLVDDALGDSGVDVAQIRRALALSPAERIRAAACTERGLARLRGRAVR